MRFLNKFVTAAVLIAVLSWTAVAHATITFTNVNVVGPFSVGGNSKMVVGYMDLGGTYTTNGFSITPSQFGLSTLQQVIVEPTDAYSAVWLPATAKIYMKAGDGTEVANDGGLSTTNINFMVIGW